MNVAKIKKEEMTKDEALLVPVPVLVLVLVLVLLLVLLVLPPVHVSLIVTPAMFRHLRVM